MVVVLPGMDQHVVDALGRLEPGDHPRQPDDFRSRADDRHHLQGVTFWAYWSGLSASSSWSAQNIVTRSADPTLRRLCTHMVGMSTNPGSSPLTRNRTTSSW